MKKEMKKVLTLVLICAMLVSSFVGCKKSDSKETSKTPTKAATDSTVTEAASDAAAGMDSWVPFKDKVTITVPVYDRSLEGMPAVDNNYWTQWIQKEFGDKWNIEVKYVAIPRTDVMTKYTTLIAAGDTPTILMEYDYPKVAQWANDGAMQTIDMDAFAKVAPTYYQKMVDNDQLQYSKLGGENYFVLSERPYFNSSYTWVGFVRKDWLDKVGKAVPTNYKEYCDTLDAIMKAGLTDQAPVDISLPTSGYDVNYGFRDYPVNVEDWAKYSSLSIAALPWSADYKLLQRQNAEYNKGYISKEYDLDADGSQAKTDFINGKTYSYAGYVSANTDWLTAFYKQNPDAKLAVADVDTGYEEGVTTHSYRTNNPFGMIVGFSSTANEDQLKAAWMYMEWMCQTDTLTTLENGVEGKTYKMGDDGIPIIDGTYTGEERLNYNCNIDYTCVAHASKTLGSIEKDIKVITPQGLPQDFYQDIVNGYNKQMEYSKYAYTDPIFSVAIASESEYSASLLSLWQQDSVQLTKCKPSEFDALYKKLSQEYLDAGYQEVIDERLKAYQDGNSTKLPDAAE